MKPNIAFLGLVVLTACAPRPASGGRPMAPATEPSPHRAACSVLHDPALERGTTVPPLPLGHPVVAYPPEVRQPDRGRDSALVRLVVGRGGEVPACAVTVQMVSDPALLPYVIPAAAALRFRPAEANGTPAPAWVTLPLFFMAADEARTLMDTPLRVEEPMFEEPPSLLGDAPTPLYPSELVVQRLSGRVVVSATVLPDGRIDMATVRVVRSDHPLFTRAVRSVLPDFRFRPARRGPDGPAVAAQIELPFEFLAP